jgi:prepilin-type N-terminal cleavage/methylation domain-containing protein
MLNPQTVRISRGSQNGFTLIELLVAMLIGSALFAVVPYTITQTFASNTRATAHVSVVTDVQLAVDRVSRDVRVANPIVAATTTSLTSRIYRAGTCTLVTYAVTSVPLVDLTASGYRATGNSLTSSTALCSAPNTVTSTGVLIRAIPTTAMPFSYLDANGAAVLPPFADQASLNHIFQVQISLQGSDRSGYVQALNTTVDVRNVAP